MTVTPLHRAIDSADCAIVGCPSEAEPGSEFCRLHANSRAARCKIEGCENPPASMAGPYARLCAEHREEERERRANPPAATTADSLAAQARAVVPLAAKLDRLRARLRQLPSNERARAAFDEASRRASVNPTPENLARVQAAIRELQKSAPKRVQIESEIAHVERAIGLALKGLVQGVRGSQA